MAKKPQLTKLEFARQMSTYANISVPQAEACIEFYSYVFEECIKNNMEFQIYNIGKFHPKIIEQRPEREGWNSFSNVTFVRPQHGDYIKAVWRAGTKFKKRLQEATEQPYDESRPDKKSSQENKEVDEDEG